MKRSIIIIIFFFISFTTIFCNYTDKTSLTEAEQDYIKKKLDYAFDDFYDRSNTFHGRNLEYFDEAIKKTFARYNELNENSSEIERFIISHLSDLFKEKYYIRTKEYFDGLDGYGMVTFVLNLDIFKNYTPEDPQYIPMLDMIFYSYMKNVLFEYVYMVEKRAKESTEKGLKNLEKYKDYDNYYFYLGKFSYMMGTYFSEGEEQKRYLETYEKYKSETLNRKEEISPLHKYKVIRVGKKYFSSYSKKRELPKIAYPEFYFLEYLPEGYY